MNQVDSCNSISLLTDWFIGDWKLDRLSFRSSNPNQVYPILQQSKRLVSKHESSSDPSIIFISCPAIFQPNLMIAKCGVIAVCVSRTLFHHTHDRVTHTHARGWVLRRHTHWCSAARRSMSRPRKSLPKLWLWLLLAIGIVTPFVFRMVAICLVNEGDGNIFFVKCYNCKLNILE